MDLTALHKGVIQLAAGAAAIFNISIAPAAPPNEGLLQSPDLPGTYDLPLDVTDAVDQSNQFQSLNSVTEPEGLKLVLKVPEARASEIITVEEPPLNFTVVSPTPKPSAKPSEEPETPKKPEAEKEVDAEEAKKDETKSPEPSSSPAASQSTPNADLLFQMTNDHRTKIGKPALEKDDRLCKIAGQRAPQVNGELKSGTLHQGFKELNLPYWATENLAAYQTMNENFNFLVTDYIHKKAIEGDYKYSCTACSGTSCSQIFSSFAPK